ncbi:MAG: PhoH family protein [Victivallaceae bacterium]|nr:PhoH family protein [Victivallaceae bacterium]
MSRRKKESEAVAVAPVKTFVLDTNVLLHSAQSIEAFKEHDVVIPMAVVEELDKFKKNSDELGRNTRRVIRMLDRLRQSVADQGAGKLAEGVPLGNVSSVASGKLYVICAPVGKSDVGKAVDAVFGSELDLGSPDNRILRVACELKAQGKDVTFISKDINLRLKADALGLKVMDMERGKVDGNALYTGFVAANVASDKIDRLYREREIPSTGFSLLANEFVVLNADGNAKKSALTRLRSDGKLHLLDVFRESVWNVFPRNKEQRMALDVLLDPDVRLVTLVGGAGTGKTLLVLAVALQAVLRDALYDRILVSRPIIPLGNDIGFLPGDKGAKLSSWMQPIFDNLEFLIGGDTEKKPKSSAHYSVESLINSHKLELEALTYIRGRSISRQFVIIDEAQNLTPHEVKAIGSRGGDDTKMVLTGDPQQIDNPYLDASSNGLSYAVERMKGQAVFGHVTLAKSERSDLAALAAQLL